MKEIEDAASTVFAVFMPWWLGGIVNREAAREALFGLERALSRIPPSQPEATPLVATAPADPGRSAKSSLAASGGGNDEA